MPAKPAAATEAAAPVVDAGAASPPVVVAALSEPPLDDGDVCAQFSNGRVHQDAK